MKEQLQLVLSLCALVTLLARGSHCHPLQETVAPVQEERSRGGPDLFSSVQDTDILVRWTRCNVQCLNERQLLFAGEAEEDVTNREPFEHSVLPDPDSSNQLHRCPGMRPPLIFFENLPQ